MPFLHMSNDSPTKAPWHLLIAATLSILLLLAVTMGSAGPASAEARQSAGNGDACTACVLVAERDRKRYRKAKRTYRKAKRAEFRAKRKAHRAKMRAKVRAKRKLRRAKIRAHVAEKKAIRKHIREIESQYT